MTTRWANCCNVRDLSVCCVPKSGSTSIKAALISSQGLPVENIHGNKALSRTLPEDAHNSPVAFVRHPWSRLVGTWQHKLHGKRTAVTKGFEKRGFWHGMPLDKYLVRLLAVHEDDCHTASQVVFLPPQGCTLYRVEAIAQGWRRLQLGRPWLAALPFYGKRYPEPDLEPGKLGRFVLEELYKKDLEIWHSADS